MRDNKDKRLEKKQLLAIREKVASLLVDVDSFHRLFYLCDYCTICCGKIQYIVYHVQLVIVYDRCNICDI